MLSVSEINDIIKSIRIDIKKAAEGLVFEPNEHKYIYNGTELPSVSEICTKFEREFDADYWSKSKAIDSGKTPEEVLAEWRANSDTACETGSEAHAYAEWKFYSHTGLPIENDDIRAINESVKNSHYEKDARMECVDEIWEIFKSQSTLIPVASENRVVNPELGYAGTFDLLCLKVNADGTCGLVIFDYKTNSNLFNIFKPRYGEIERMRHTLSHLESCNAANYSCQLNLYQLGLERATKVPVIARIIFWINPSGVEAIENNTPLGYQLAHQNEENEGKKSKWRFFRYYINEISNLKRQYRFRKQGNFGSLHLPDLREEIIRHLKFR